MKISEFNRQKARVSFYKAWDLISQGRYDAAQHSLKSAIKYYPRFVPAHLLLLDILKQNNEEEKLSHYINSLEKEDNEVTLYVRGLMAEDLDQKLHFFTRSLQIIPDYFWVLYTINLIIHDQPQIQEQVAAIVSNREESATFYYTRGLIEHYFENLGNAIQNYEKALTIDKRLVDVHFNLAVAYHEIKDESQAIRHYEKTTSYNPYFVDGFYNLGCHYYDIGEFKKAIDYFKQALEIDPYFLEAHNNLSICYVKMGVLNAAESELKKAIQIAPLNRDIHINYGYFLFLNQTYEKALEEYQKAIDLTDDGLMDTLQKGLECIQLGKLQGHQMEWKLFPIARPDTPMIHSLKKLL